MGQVTFFLSWSFIVASVSAFVTHYLLTEQRKKKDEDAEKFDKVIRMSTQANLPLESRNGLVEGLLQNLWSHSIGPAASVVLKETLTTVLESSVPSLKLVQCDLGDAPLKIANATVQKVNPKTNSCEIDFDVIWDGDCDIKLRMSKLGGFGVSKIKFLGRISLVMKPLTQVLPCMGGVSYCLVNRPVILLDFTGLASVGDVSLINKKILEAILVVVQNMLVLPYRMYMKMDVAAKLKDIYQPPIAVARITITKGRGFVLQKSTVGKGDIPDPYVKIKMGDRTIQTIHYKDELNPNWGNDHPLDFLVHDYDQVLTVEIWDFDSRAFDGDDHLGWAQPTVKEILMAPKRSKEIELMKENTTDEPVGAYVTVNCTMIPLSISPVPISPHQGKNEKNELKGLMAIFVERAFDIPLDKKQAITKITVTTPNAKGAESLFETGIVQLIEGTEVDVLNPVFDSVFEIPLSYEEDHEPDITLTLHQLDESLDEDKQKVLGKTTVTWKDLQENPEMNFKRALDCSVSATEIAPSIEFGVVLYSIPGNQLHKNAPTQLTDEIDDLEETMTYIPRNTSIKSSKLNSSKIFSPLQPQSSKVLSTSLKSEDLLPKVSLMAVSGHGFVVKRKRLGKKDVPDVYLKIKVGNNDNNPKGVWETSVMKDSIKPEWNESKIFQYDNIGEGKDTIIVTGWDKNSGKLDTDDYYGEAITTIETILLAGGKIEVQLKDTKGKETGLYIVLKCSLEEDKNT